MLVAGYWLAIVAGGVLIVYKYMRIYLWSVSEELAGLAMAGGECKGIPLRPEAGLRKASLRCDKFYKELNMVFSELNMIIRNETESDIEAISDVTKAAFKNCPYSHQTEQFIVTALRADNALTISLVAEVGGKVVGHIAFSLVTISDGSQNWYGLGPVSVLPELQKQGIGKSLINKGLSMLKESGARGCVLVGDPNYYERFGFKSLSELTHEGVPQEYVLALPFGENKARGVVAFHKGFSATE